MKRYEVIIIGAGVAGLACASELSKFSKKILLLEGQDHIGGRVKTIRANPGAQALELGAEFIHGHPKATLDLVRQMGMSFVDMPDNHLVSLRGRIRKDKDFFEKIDKILKKIKLKSNEDMNVVDFEKSLEGVTARELELFESFIEGFQAADRSRMSVKSLVPGPSDDAQDESSRLHLGYDQLFGAFSVPHIQFNKIVNKISWRRGEVDLEVSEMGSGKISHFHARRVVITASLGVLKSTTSKAQIQFLPRPARLDQALAAMDMGHVQKLIFEFTTPFWEKPLGMMSFIHTTPDKFFPTWWTLAPVRSPFLVAWQGGPKAQEISGWSEDRKQDVALSTLASITKKPKKFLRSQVKSVHHHDWGKDPFTEGAYSYIAEGGMKNSVLLRKPIEGTLFFAGEAILSGNARGTVHGAIQSGQHAAAQIKKLLKS